MGTPKTGFNPRILVYSYTSILVYEENCAVAQLLTEVRGDGGAQLLTDECLPARNLHPVRLAFVLDVNASRCPPSMPRARGPKAARGCGGC